VPYVAGGWKSRRTEGHFVRNAASQWIPRAISAPRRMDISTNQALTILQQGEVTLKGEFLWGSNYTFLVQVTHEGQKVSGVYKPIKGERPLWDFPASSLARREVAAFLVSEALGWELVPPTVYRKKGPLGAGSLQFYVDHDPEYYYFNFSPEDVQRLRPTAVFDLLINNADRKGSHVLKEPNGHLWLIDHGVCFHVEDKLRTVIWDFVDEPIPDELCKGLCDLQEKLESVTGAPSPLTLGLEAHISMPEIRAMKKRAETLVTNGYFPAPDPNRRPFPWPQI